MDPRNAIEVRHMSKHFKINRNKANTLKEKILFFNKKGNIESFEVLKDISFNIKKGETVALIGTNGSGKSTLLKLMTQIIYPNKGTVETQGKLTSLLELGAGFHPDFTGRENIYFNASIFGLTRRDIDDRLEDIIAFSELGDAIDDPIRTYSSGMYMRLAFSVAINVDADILLIDEILAVGDQHFQDKCFDKLEELRESDKTIVIVTHSLDVVKKLCDRAIWIYKGEFRLDGDPAFVIEEYLQQVEKDHHDERRQAIAEGREKLKSVIYVDHPRDFSHIECTEPVVHFSGWELSNGLETEFCAEIDGHPVQTIDRYPRPDVYDVYAESYLGFINKSTLGWSFPVDISKLEKGKHTLSVYDLINGQKLGQKEVIFSVD